MHVKVIIFKNDRKIFIMTNSLYITFLKTNFLSILYWITYGQLL